MAIQSFTPTGLNPVKYLNGALWNGQVSQYRIKSGYNFNIFRGDPVIIGENGAAAGYGGYLLSYADYNRTSYKPTTPVIGNIPTLGVFVGCSYQDKAGINPADPASPGRLYWPASTATLADADAIAYVIDDPNVVYEIQTSTSTSNLTAFNCAIFSGLTQNTSPSGNTQNGISQVGMTSISASPLRSSAPADLRLLRLSADPRNEQNAPNNIWEVILHSHYFAARSAV